MGYVIQEGSTGTILRAPDLLMSVSDLIRKVFPRTNTVTHMAIEQNAQYFVKGIFEYNFLNESICILIDW